MASSFFISSEAVVTVSIGVVGTFISVLKISFSDRWFEIVLETQRPGSCVSA